MPIAVLEQSNNLYFPNPFELEAAEESIKTSYPPVLFANDKKSVAALVKKYIRQAGIPEDAITPKVIYDAKAREQTRLLLEAVNDDLPLAKKSPLQQEIWKEVVENKRPMYLFPNVGGKDLDTMTFVPVWQVRHEENDIETNWVCRVGVPGHEIAFTKSLQYCEFICGNLADGLEYAYKLFNLMREEERSFFVKKVSEYGKHINKEMSWFVGGELLKQTGKVAYAGEDPLVIEMGEDGEYMLVLLKSSGGHWEEIRFPFEADSPFHAVEVAEAYAHLVSLNNHIVLPEDAESTMNQAMLDVHHCGRMRLFEAERVRFAKQIFDHVHLYEFDTEAGKLLVMRPPRGEIFEGVGKYYAFVFANSVEDFSRVYCAGRELPQLNEWLNPDFPWHQPQDDLPINLTGYLSIENHAVTVEKIVNSGQKKTKPVVTVNVVPAVDTEAIICTAGLFIG